MMGQFTKEEAQEAILTLDEIFNALSRPKQREFLGHLNQVCLFLEAAKREAPTEMEAEEAKQD